jgi:DNA-binding GntR family transcriptional regulator
MNLESPAAFDFSDRKTLAGELAPLLEREIITRRLKPGERLVELDLCARFGVSRSPMREALRLLEASLLAVRKPHYGVRVAPMTVHNLDHIYTCRAPLEALAAANIAGAQERRGDVATLAACVERMEAAAKAGDVEGCFFANVELTDVLHRQCRNPVLMNLLAQVDKAALRYRHWAFFEEPAVISLSIGANRDLTEAIRNGKPKRAESITRELVLETWRRVRQTFLARERGTAAE